MTTLSERRRIDPIETWTRPIYYTRIVQAWTIRV
jgi:hypothetical protein